jgi:hypothetical protein
VSSAHHNWIFIAACLAHNASDQGGRECISNARGKAQARSRPKAPEMDWQEHWFYSQRHVACSEAQQAQECSHGIHLCCHAGELLCQR